MIDFELTGKPEARDRSHDKRRVVGFSSFFVSKREGAIPYKPKHPCSFPRCPELAQAGEQYCDRHKKQEQKQYDKQRGTAAQRGYGSRWKKYRRWYLQRYPLCVNYDECHNVATVVDHIKPVSKGGAFYDPENHQAMCTPCHDSKTAREDGRWG